MSTCRANVVCKIGGVTAMAAGMAALSFTETPLAAVTLAETGSTLIYPLFKAWIAAYRKSLLLCS